MKLLVLCTLTAASSLTAQQIDDTFTRQLEQRIAAVMTEAHLPGVAVGIVHGDSLVLEMGFGVADRMTGRGVDGETLFQIGSLSKSFTSTLLALLVDDGLITFHDPITDHLPTELRVPTAPQGAPSVRQLATHTSGLPRQPPTLRRLHGDYPVLAFSHFELYQSLEAAQLERAPGEGFAYSNFGYSVLGHILERVGARPYELLVSERVFRPLRMRSSTVTIWLQFEPRLARPYYWNNRTGVLEDYTPWDTEAMAPAGGIASTIHDLARFVSYQFGADGALLEIREPLVALGDGLAYGMGWFVLELEGVGTVINHGGEVDGYTSYLGFSPDHRLGVIILTNAGDGPLEPVANWIFLDMVGRLGF